MVPGGAGLTGDLLGPLPASVGVAGILFSVGTVLSAALDNIIVNPCDSISSLVMYIVKDCGLVLDCIIYVNCLVILLRFRHYLHI